MFYSKRKDIVIVPAYPAISDDDEEEDDDVEDPDFVPPTHNLDIPGPSDMGLSAKRRCLQPAVLQVDDDDDDGDSEQPALQAKRPTKPRKSAARPTTWHKDDLENTELPEYQHSPPYYIETPFQYFTRYFGPAIVTHITYQTNLYATQKDINTTFTTNDNEIMTFLSILMFMGISELPIC
ncbi:hypothetical protein CgunFtcFv8_018077 [Champsocephalus gunnari]|uniref:PiggyBac transposable element-derived protein domain-containing protein n=1 Tax=Champsocephalus gunnari TaxID=52237 RepID=A0AAN8DNJ6_CHAGU|nr:hypothetical protein CgunFtcFv8_018077 [Champsocephalus gunnari]